MYIYVDFVLTFQPLISYLLTLNRHWLVLKADVSPVSPPNTYVAADIGRVPSANTYVAADIGPVLVILAVGRR